MAVKAKREWHVCEQEGTSGGVTYIFKSKAAAIKRFDRLLKTVKGGTVTAIELWDAKRVARISIKLPRPFSCRCPTLKEKGKTIVTLHRSACEWHKRPVDEQMVR